MSEDFERQAILPIRRSKVKNISCMIAIITGLLFMFSAQVQAEPLEAEALKAEIVNRAFEYKGRENGQLLQGVIAYRGDGKLFIKTREGYLDGGTWRIAKNAFCTRVTIQRKNDEVCFLIEPRGRNYRTSHGFTLRPLKETGFLGA